VRRPEPLNRRHVQTHNLTGMEQVVSIGLRRQPVCNRLPLCSGCCRWALPSVLTLTATKQLLGTATGAGPNGGCGRYCGHRASETRLPPRHRPLPHHLNWWYRPNADLDVVEVTAQKAPFI
jgi:hypothetical protein